MNSDNQDYFDFTTEHEWPEEPSSNKRRCPHCDKPISVDSLFCLFCGEPVSKVNKNKCVVLVVFLVLITLLLWIVIL